MGKRVWNRRDFRGWWGEARRADQSWLWEKAQMKGEVVTKVEDLDDDQIIALVFAANQEGLPALVGQKVE